MCPGTYYLTWWKGIPVFWLFQENFKSLKISPPSVMTENRLCNEDEVWCLLSCLVPDSQRGYFSCPCSLKLPRGKWEWPCCHMVFILWFFSETNASLKSSAFPRFKKEKKKQKQNKNISSFKKVLLYQTRVMDGIITMLSEQEPELHYKCEIFYEDQMETLNA